MRAFTAGQIAQYVNAIEMNEAAVAKREKRVRINPDFEKRVIMLKELTWQYVILNRSMNSKQYGHRNN